MEKEPYDVTIEQVEAVALKVVGIIRQNLQKNGEVYACMGMVEGLLRSMENQNMIIGVGQ